MQSSPPARKKKLSGESVGKLDRLPPYSAEAEIGVLGCVIIDPQRLATVIELLPDGEKSFYDLRNQLIYKTMVELWTDNDPIDTISVTERLTAFGELEQAGGISYLATLPDQVPSAANMEYYVGIVLEKHLLRQMIRVCIETVGKLYEAEGDIDTKLDECERDVLSVNESRVKTSTPSIRALVKEVIVDIERAKDGKINGLPTGFIDYDKLIGGMKDADMIVLAARPGMGKTSYALNIVEYLAVENRIPVGVFSLEMSAKQLTHRLLCSRARVNSKQLAFITNLQIEALSSATAKISSAPIYIDDMGGQSVLQIRAKARRMKQQNDIKMIIIDYLQLMQAIGGNKSRDSRQNEVAQISCGVKALAKELNLPILVLAQLNREVERDNNRCPRLSDLRESGAIEQDADLVTFLYQTPDKTDEDADTSEIMPVTAYVAKHRNGPTGNAYLLFEKTFTRFRSLQPVNGDYSNYQEKPEYQQQEM